MPTNQTKKIFSYSLVIAALLLLGSMQFLQAEPLKVTIRAEDVTADSFWRIDYFDNDPANSPLANFATHPVPVTSLGDFEPSSLRMYTGAGTSASNGCASLGGKAYFGTQALEGLKLSELEKLDFHFLIETNTDRATKSLSIFVNIFVDTNGDDMWRREDDTLFHYEPYYTRGQFTNLNTWYGNNAIGDSADGRWHVGNGTVLPHPDLKFTSPHATNDLWSEIIALEIEPGKTVGDLKIVNPDPGCITGEGSGEGTGSGVAFVLGQKSGGGFSNMVAYLDRIVLATSGEGDLAIAETVYDLSAEPAPVETESPTPEKTPVTPSPTPEPTEVPATELLLNGGFETADSNNKNVPANWQVKNATKDKLKCDKPNKKLAHEGTCMFQFKGGVGEKSKLQQNVDVTATTYSAGETLTLSGFVFAKGDVNAKVMVKVVYGDDTKDKITAKIAKTNGEYVALTGELSLDVKQQPDKIKVIVKNKGTKGKVRVDALSLTKSAAAPLALPLP